MEFERAAELRDLSESLENGQKKPGQKCLDLKRMLKKPLKFEKQLGLNAGLRSLNVSIFPMFQELLWSPPWSDLLRKTGQERISTVQDKKF